MNDPIDIGTLPVVAAGFAAVLAEPAAHLVTAADPLLGFGRLHPPAAGRAEPACGMVIIVLAGSLTLEGIRLGGRQRLAALGPGRPVSWQADTGCVLAVIADPRLGHAAGVTPLDADAGLEASAAPAAAALLTPAPDCAAARVYESDAVSYGLWSATPYRRRHAVSAVSEFMFLLNGSVTLSAPEGRPVTFDENALLLVAQGMSMDWHSACNVRKFYYSARME